MLLVERIIWMLVQVVIKYMWLIRQLGISVSNFNSAKMYILKSCTIYISYNYKCHYLLTLGCYVLFSHLHMFAYLINHFFYILNIFLFLPPFPGPLCENSGDADCRLVAVNSNLCNHWYYKTVCCQMCRDLVSHSRDYKRRRSFKRRSRRFKAHQVISPGFQTWN